MGIIMTLLILAWIERRAEHLEWRKSRPCHACATQGENVKAIWKHDHWVHADTKGPRITAMALRADLALGVTPRPHGAAPQDLPGQDLFLGI